MRYRKNYSCVTIHFTLFWDFIALHIYVYTYIYIYIYIYVRVRHNWATEHEHEISIYMTPIYLQTQQYTVIIITLYNLGEKEGKLVYIHSFCYINLLMYYFWVSSLGFSGFQLPLWESQFLGRLKRSLGSLRSRKRSGTLKAEISSVQLLSRVQLFATPWIAACQASLSIITPGVHPNSCPLSQWCHPTISPSVIPFSSCPQFFPASGSFPIITSSHQVGKQSIGVPASTSVIPVNTQDWSPLRWTGWISLQSKGLSRVFSNTTVQKHQFFSAQLSL